MMYSIGLLIAIFVISQMFNFNFVLIVHVLSVLSLLCMLFSSNYSAGSYRTNAMALWQDSNYRTINKEYKQGKIADDFQTIAFIFMCSIPFYTVSIINLLLNFK